MRKLLFLLALALPVAIPLSLTSCASLGTPAVKQNEVLTLKVIGTAAKASIDSAAVLLAQGQINVAQWTAVARVYDLQFQPVYAVAVTAARSDLSSPASPDLVRLFGEIAALVASYIPAK